MNHLLLSPRFGFHHSPPPSNDVEMLQTDVMRFFAILCLCLMAIFALVKTLPMSPPVASPTIAAPPDSSPEAPELQKKNCRAESKTGRAPGSDSERNRGCEKPERAGGGCHRA